MGDISWVAWETGSKQKLTSRFSVEVALGPAPVGESREAKLGRGRDWAAVQFSPKIPGDTMRVSPIIFPRVLN